MTYLTIEEVKSFFSKAPATYEYLTNLFRTCIAEKKPLFAPTEVPGLEDLLKCGSLIQSPGGRYEFNYKSLVVCYVVKEVAEDHMKETMPLDIIGALDFADRFYLSIRQPKPKTTWYFHLALEFDRFILIYLNQQYQVDVATFYTTITDSMLEDHIPLRHYDISFYAALPLFEYDIKTTFQMLIWMYEQPNKREYAGNALTELGKVNSSKATQLYEYGKINQGIEQHEFLGRLLTELYTIAPEKYFAETMAIFNDSPTEGLYALARILYTNENHILAASNAVLTLDANNKSHHGDLTIFYTRLIENRVTPANIRANCFSSIGELLKIEDNVLRSNLIWRVGMIEGFDVEKMALLPQIMDLNPGYIKDFFHHFDNASYLFDLIKETYLELGPAVDFRYFSDAVTDIHHRHPEEFETELLKLLTADLALSRLAGIMIMRSRYGGFYEVDFLKLDEQKQLRILETLLPHPASIEDLLPAIFHLRKSPYETVKRFFNEQIAELIWAYDHHLLDIVKPLLEDNKADEELFQYLNDSFNDFEQIKQQKVAIGEFDPTLNELEDFDYYFKTEQEQRAEQMELATGQSFITQMAKNISVIRGSGFKSDISQQITRMGKISTSMLIDMRYYRDPDEYQWEYNQHMTALNYPTEGADE